MTSSMAASTAASFASSTLEAPEAGTETSSSRGGVEGKSAEVAATVAPVTEILNAATETKQTDTVPVIAQHNTPNTHNNNHNNNNNTKTVPTAVVEKSQTRTVNPNSKIPHPLVALLASKTNQFRRSASVRMRGSKANFLFNTFNRDTHSHRHSCSNNKSHIHNHSHPRPRTSCKMEQQLFTSTSISSSNNSNNNNNSRHGINNTSSVPTQNDQTAFGHHQVTDGLSTGAGRVSPRRKLVLSSQPNAPRSLSLNRAENLNQHKIEKTDPFTELEVCCSGVDEAGKDEAIVKQHNCDGDDGSRSCSSLAVTASFTDQAKVVPSTGVSVDVISCSTPNNRSAAQGCPAIVDEPGIRVEHNNKMSLNLNGPQTTGTTLATTKTAATATTTAPVASTTNIRPTTLTAAPTVSIAGNTTATTTTGSVTIAATATTSATPSRIVTKTLPPKTPKTPATTRTVQGHQQQQASNQQHCSHQHCSAKYQYQPHQQHLPTVPETIKPTPRTPPVTPDSPSNYLEDDIDSLYSFATTTSGRSTMSCEHPYVACNGTTFSGRKMKYVVHCSNYAGQVGPDYLTPTQRAQRQIRRLKELLSVARHDLEQKDSDILGLTREVVELRLFKASLSSPEDRSASSDAVTVREAELKTSQDVSPIVDMVDDATKCSPRHLVAQQQQQQQTLQLSSSEMQSSFADSGHFEDMTSSSVHSKDSFNGHTHDIACGRDASEACATGGRCGGIGEDDDEDEGDGDGDARKTEGYELQRQNLIRLYEQRIEELIRTQDSASSEIKRSHNDKVEALLQKLAECNTRYADIVLSSENAKERIRELEKQLEDLQRKLAEHEDKQNKMYLQMYQKGQEAERIARADQALELAHRVPNNKVSINELLLQLQSTQDELENIRTIYRRLLDAQKNRTHVDPEVTLQFLKSAVYYFLTDKENSQGHLRAIESILEFTETEKQNISKARAPK